MSFRLRSTISGSLFVGLNIADAWLTNRLLVIGGVEGNPMSGFYPLIARAYSFDLILIKGLLASVIVIALVWFGKARILWLLNVGISAVVLVNAIGFLSYLAGFYGWF